MPRSPDLFARVFERRLTTVIAGPGFGKSTALGAWAQGVPSVWYTVDGTDPGKLAAGIVEAIRSRVPELTHEANLAAGRSARGRDAAFSTVLCAVLDDLLAEDLALVLDDVHELGRSGAGPRILEALIRQAPHRLHIVIASRHDPPFSVERLRANGDLLDVGARDLALSVRDVESLLRIELGAVGPDLATRLHELSAGWPVAVRLASEALRGLAPAARDGAIVDIARGGGTLYGYLAEEVFAGERPDVRQLLQVVARLHRFTPELTDWLGVPDGRASLRSLLRRGLFVETRGDEGWFAVHPLAREFMSRRAPLGPAEHATLQRLAAGWFAAHGHDEDALRALTAAADPAAVNRFLAERGSALIMGGRFTAIIEAGAMLTDSRMDSPAMILVAEAQLATGNLGPGRELLARAAGRCTRLPGDLAARLGLAYLDQPRQALEMLMPVLVREPETEGDAFVLGLAAQAACIIGEPHRARQYAERGLAAALGNDWAWAAAEARLSLGMIASREGQADRARELYMAAIASATRAGNVAQIATSHIRLATLLVERGRFGDALGELEPAIRQVDLAGLAGLRAWGRAVRGEAYLGLGRLDDARAECEAARDIYERSGSRFILRALRGLGDVLREQGNLALARAMYESALAPGDDELPAELAMAMAGLARVTVATDTERAARLVRSALALIRATPAPAAVHLAAGWVALWRNRRAEARSHATEAAADARHRLDPWRLAESLELEALTSDGSPGSPGGALEEAGAIWRGIGNPVGAARTDLALARMSTRPGTGARAARSEQRLRSLGVRPLAASRAAGLLAFIPWPDLAPVAIQTLGGFCVLRAGIPANLDAWRRSRKAQQLLKLLVAGRGRPVPKEVLMDALWPEVSPEGLANRFSVALAAIRHVLDPDRRFPPDHYVRSDGDAVAIDPARLPVDVERFLALADAGLALLREGDGADALELLEAGEEAYAGDFLEEDAYSDWARPLRDEARDTYRAVVEALARASGEAGDHHRAAHYLLRALERDPYDEDAHLGLVATLERIGQHGKARRRYLAYVARMEEISVEPGSFPRPDRPEGRPAV